MQLSISSVEGKVPTQKTVEVFVAAIHKAAFDHAGKFGYERDSLLFKLNRLLETVDTFSSITLSKQVLFITDTLQVILSDASPRLRGRNHRKVEDYRAFCLYAALVFQRDLFTRSIELEIISGDDKLDRVGLEFCGELIAMWKHVPWFVEAVNLGQPEIVP